MRNKQFSAMRVMCLAANSLAFGSRLNLLMKPDIFFARDMPFCTGAKTYFVNSEVEVLLSFHNISFLLHETSPTVESVYIVQ